MFHFSAQIAAISEVSPDSWSVTILPIGPNNLIHAVVIALVIASADLFSRIAVTVYLIDSSNKCSMMASSKNNKSHCTISPNFSASRVDTIDLLLGLVQRRHILQVDTIVGICLMTPSETPAVFNNEVMRAVVACHQRICSLCNARLMTAGLSDLRSRSAVPRS